ncbi:MAG: UDP-N-acetylglucosamine 2-epimerase (hydrolyzing) [Chitinophagaceae bacterium]|nr:UDP-N-acetylglucosamine 2-epimerase (hydrolyzing) [Chitinophagaceae bacterium]
MKTICVVTGTRAEYGLLYHTMKAIQEHPDLKLQICVCGMHLSPEFGLTWQQIEQDGFVIDARVDMLLSADTAVAITKSTGLGLIGFADAFEFLKPDMILILGDRFEMLAASTAAMIANIPIAHCHGGEATEGLIDEAIRHAITKMAHLHFTSTETYRKRVIQLGEQPERVFNVGALGIENINKLELLNREDLERSLGIQLKSKNYLVTFHPVTLEKQSASAQFDQLLQAMESYSDAFVVFTLPNADTDGRTLIEQIQTFVQKHPDRSAAFTSLGQLRYLSLIPQVDAVIGNSSSGLIEVPAFGIPTINIGDRQRGRMAGDSVIHCEAEKESILRAIEQSETAAFRQQAAQSENPYGKANASGNIVSVLRSIDLNKLLKKHFYDLP